MKKFMKKLLMLILGLFLLCPNAYAMYPWTFTNGTVADATQVNANDNYFEGKYSTVTGHRHDGTDSRLINTFAGLVTGSFVAGDIIYATDTNTLGRLAVGTAGQVLTVSGGMPAWAGSTSGNGARAYSSADQLNTASGAYVQVALDLETFDINSEFNTGTYTFTAKSAGYYVVYGSITYFCTVDAKPYASVIYVDGVLYDQLSNDSSAAASNLSVMCFDIIYLGVGHTISLYSLHTDGVGTSDVLHASGYTYLDVFKLP